MVSRSNYTSPRDTTILETTSETTNTYICDVKEVVCHIKLYFLGVGIYLRISIGQFWLQNYVVFPSVKLR